MNRNDIFDKLSQQLASVLPMAGEMSADLKERTQSIIRQSLSEMNILTREEFESQSIALDRAEERIDELEVTLAKLETEILSLKKPQ